MQERLEYLINKFGLSLEDCDKVSSYFKEITLPKNHFFVSEGKVQNSCAILLDGVVRYFSYDEDGNDPTCYFSFENHLLMDPFTYRLQKPASLNIVSVNTCKLAVLNCVSEKSLIEEFPRWSDMAKEMVLEMSLEFANQKEMVNIRAAERYNFFLTNYANIAYRIPLQYVATYLGVTQQSLSRLRRGDKRKK